MAQRLSNHPAWAVAIGATELIILWRAQNLWRNQGRLASNFDVRRDKTGSVDTTMMRGRSLRTSAMVWTCACLCALAAPLWAQEKPKKPAAEAAPANWKWKQIDAEAQTSKSKPPTPEISAALRSGQIGDQQAFDDFLNLRIAEFTWAVNDARLVDVRKNFRNQIARQATGAARDRVNQTTLRRMREMAEDAAYSPAARSNAVLLIGELNERDPAPGTPGNPTALPAALPVLLDFIKTENSRSDVEDALALNALVGVSRHVAIGINDADMQRRIGAALLGVMRGADRPSHRPLEAHAYLRTRAALILAELGAPPGENGPAEALDALMRMVADHEAPVWMRYYAARGVGAINLQGVRDANFSLAAHLLAELVVQTAEKFEVRREKKAYGALLLEALDGRPANSDPPRGLVRTAPQDQAEHVTEVYNHIKAIVERIDKPLSRELNPDQRRDEELKLSRDLVELVDGLKTWLEENPIQNRVLLPGTAEFAPEQDLAQAK